MPSKIAAFGEIMMRLQVPGYELLKQANTLQFSFSGTGVNVLSALANFGHRGYLVSALPSNAVGDAALTFLNKLGIEDTFVCRYGDDLGLYFLENGFGNRSSRVTYSKRSISSFNTAPTNIYDLHKISKNVDFVHFCGISLAMNDQVRHTMIQFAETAKVHDCIIVFDCNYRSLLWGEDGHAKAKTYYEQMLQLADIVIMNEKDAMNTLEMTTDEKDWENQIKALIPQVAKKFRISIIAGTNRRIISHDKHSLQGFIYQNGKCIFSSTMTFPVFDRIGAGDAFSSGVIHGVMKGFQLQTTVSFATTASMLAHTVVGDTPMSSEVDILNAMTGTIGDIER